MEARDGPAPRRPTPPSDRTATDNAASSVPAAAVDTAAGPSRFDAAALLGLMVVLAALWGQGRHTWYWTDEALSLGISSHPLGDMRDVLAQDTAAPLFHVILHGWMRLFGSSEASTHSLSLLFALAVVPAALWAGWSLFDRRTGWACAVLAAVSPYLANYANETRMYSLVALLSVLVTATFLHGFVFRRRRVLPAFAVLMALSMYAHYWGLLLAAGAGAAVLVFWGLSDDRRRLLLDALLAFGAAMVIFAPWVPTLLYQRAHSAVGWSLVPTAQVVRDHLVGLLGGPAPALALAVGGGAALVAMLRRPWDHSSLVVVGATTLTLVVVGAGWATSQAISQWDARYLGVVLGPVLLVIGASLSRAADLGVAMLVIVGILSGPFGLKAPLNAKSNVKGVVKEASPFIAGGDVVFAPLGEIPLFAHYLPSGIRYATTTGPVADPLAADWRDAVQRLRRQGPIATLSTLVDQLPLGGHVLVSCPRGDPSEFSAFPAYVQLEFRRCLEAREYLLRRPELHAERRFPPPPGPSPRETELLTKRAAPS